MAVSVCMLIFYFFFCNVEPLSLFLICRHLMCLLFPATLRFVPHVRGKIIEWRLTPLTAHITLHRLITVLLSTSLCGLLQPSGSLVPVQYRSPVAMIALTHKRDGCPALASLSHSQCHSPPGNYQRQQAHPMCFGEERIQGWWEEKMGKKGDWGRERKD